MNQSIELYNQQLDAATQEICILLYNEITQALPEAEAKVWHGHPVWFLASNPVVGYSKQKKGMIILFWSGQSFDEPGLQAVGSFKAAQFVIGEGTIILLSDLRRWLSKSRDIQWDYKNIVKRKGELLRLK